MAAAYTITSARVGMLGTNCYILSAPGRDDCVLIDPGAEPETIRRAAGGKRIAAILLTHGHFDHILAAGDLMDADTRLLIHEADAPCLGDPVLNASAYVGSEAVAPAATELLHEGDEVEAAGLRFTVLHTPGHTRGSCCFRLENILFTGDTLFAQGWGRTDLPGGSDEAMMASLRRLRAYIRDTGVEAIHPGH